MRVRISVQNIRNGALFIRKHFISVGYDYSEKITLSHGLGENLFLFGVRIENDGQGSDVSRRFRPVEKTLRFFRNISVIRNGQTSRILPRTCGEILSLTISVTEKSFAFNLKVFSMAQPSEYLSPFSSYTLPISSAHGGKARRKRRFSEPCANNKMCFAFPNRSIIPPDLQ